MDACVAKEGFVDWNKPNARDKVFYAEYGSYGDGADLSQRAPFSKELKQEDLDDYSIEKVFGRKID